MTTLFFFVTFLSAAHSVGFVPDYLDGTAPVRSDTPTVSALEETPLEEQAPPQRAPVMEQRAAVEENPSRGVIQVSRPVKIVIPAIDMDLPVQNPSTRDLGVLDTVLQKGPARYVDSARLGERGNVIVFAHSSNLPVVRNQMYKAFNRVQELTPGDTITMVGENGTRYLYSVVSIRKVNAEEASINIAPSVGTKLTLVTCDTLTSKSARFMLEADFIGTLDS